MADAANVSKLPSKSSGKVQEIAKDFLVIGDKMLAQKIQDEEYNKKYEFNRGERQTARQDVPLAMRAHTEEEIRLQKENLDRLERLKILAEEDAKLAMQLQENETATLKRRSRKSETRQEEMVTVSKMINFGEDREMERLSQERKALEAKKSKIRQEIQDHELAMELHNREVRKYKRSLASSCCHHHHHHDNNHQHHQHDNDYHHHDNDGDRLHSAPEGSTKKHLINAGKLGGKVISLDGFRGFEVEEEIPDEERRMLINMQDEELARALQISEEMKLAKRRQAASSAKGPGGDAEMARVLQRAEELHLQDHQRDRKVSSSINSDDYLVPACRGSCHRQVATCCCENFANHRRLHTQTSLPGGTACLPGSGQNEPWFSTPRFGVHVQRDFVEQESVSRQGTKREQPKTQRSSKK